MIPILLLAMAAEAPAVSAPSAEAPHTPAAIEAVSQSTQNDASGPVPRSNPGEWVQTKDYPTSELAKRLAGITGFRLAVDNEGVVADCLVTLSSGSAVLDATACALLKARAQFTPARDEKGRKVAGFYSNRVRWVLPPPEYKPLPGGKWDVTVTVFVDETGTVVSCDFASAGNEIVSDGRGFTPCTEYPRGRRMPGFINSDGKPVKYHAVMRHTSEMIAD